MFELIIFIKCGGHGRTLLPNLCHVSDHLLTEYCCWHRLPELQAASSMLQLLTYSKTSFTGLSTRNTACSTQLFSFLVNFVFFVIHLCPATDRKSGKCCVRCTWRTSTTTSVTWSFIGWGWLQVRRNILSAVTTDLRCQTRERCTERKEWWAWAYRERKVAKKQHATLLQLPSQESSWPLLNFLDTCLNVVSYL